MKCIKCEKDYTEIYGSGKYCSEHCARARIWTEKQKQDRKNTFKTTKNYIKLLEANIKTFVCIICKCEYKGFNKYKKCEKCRREVQHFHLESSNINDYSKRTITKILKRAKKGCSICNWNEATCDIHHIEHVKQGGNNSHDNLIIVCPNCHRKIHVLKDLFITKEKLKELSIDKTFLDWKDFYHPSN